MTSTFNINLKNNFDEFSKLTGFLKELGEKNSINSRLIFQINLSLEEIFNNIVLYGYSTNKQDEIRFNFKLKRNKLIITIEDDAPEFNPLKAPKPDTSSSLKDTNVGGLGIYFFRSLMDQVIYKRKKNKNILRIEKKLVLKNDQETGV